MPLIKELFEGEHVALQALVGNMSRGVNASGSNYLNIELRDSTGSIPAKKWEISSNDDEIFVVGNIVEVVVDVIKYKEALQLKVLSAKLLDEDGIDVTRFIKMPPVPKDVIVGRFHNLVESVSDPDCQKLLNYFISKFHDKVYDAPAAVSVHHEFACGLIYHSTCIGEVCDYLASFYTDINRDLLVTAALLHDFGKMIELEGKAIYKYSLEGKLLGHISIMCAELREASNILDITSEVPVLLEHMILSHHGQLEFGSPVLPLTREALLLSMIDSLDSKMLILDKAYAETKPGEFTTKIYPLDGRCFYKAK